LGDATLEIRMFKKTFVGAKQPSKNVWMELHPLHTHEKHFLRLVPPNDEFVTL